MTKAGADTLAPAFAVNHVPPFTEEHNVPDNAQASTENQGLTQRRLQMRALGYVIIPTYGKRAMLTGWNTPDFVLRELTDTARRTAEARIIKWPVLYPQLQSTGVRIQGGLCAIDSDCDDEVLANEAYEAVQLAAPGLAAKAPYRFAASRYKFALFCRLVGDAPLTRIASAKFCTVEDLAAYSTAIATAVDGNAIGKPLTHCVEIFTGKPTSRGNCSHHMGVDGPHSYDEDGTVKATYQWDAGPTLFDTPLADLPVLTVKEAFAIVEHFERLALAAGYVKFEAYKPVQAGDVLFDIDESSRFATDRGSVGLNYDELVEEYGAYGSLRCSSNFLPGRGRSGDTSRCIIGDDNQYGMVGVYIFGDEVLHLPAAAKPTPIDEDEFAAQLNEIGKLHNVAPPADEPNWRERYENGRPKPTFHNARLAVEAMGLKCSEDIFHGRILVGRGETAPLGPLPLYVGVVTDKSIGALRVATSDRFGRDFTEKNIRDAVITLAHENKFDPVCEMLAEAEANWDGVARLGMMAVDHFNTADTELNKTVVIKTMIAAVARARNPGCKFDTILTMESPEGWNKSSAWALLAGQDNFSDESIIGKASREVQEQLAGIWIHENAELAGMRKAEVETVKAFASRVTDRARPAYGHLLVEAPRRSIEIATTNSDKYLLSMTGNRRFWPIKILRPIDLKVLLANRLQLWGEAAHYQSRGESLTIPEHLWTVAAVEQEARRLAHPWEALLVGLTSVSAVPEIAGVGYVGNGIVHRVGDEERVSTAAIFEWVLKVPQGQQHIGHSKTLAEIMRKLGWTGGALWLDGKTVKGYSRTKLT